MNIGKKSSEGSKYIIYRTCAPLQAALDYGRFNQANQAKKQTL